MDNAAVSQSSMMKRSVVFNASDVVAVILVIAVVHMTNLLTKAYRIARPDWIFLTK